ncbi:MAG: hypothetical protein WCW27_03665 [Patescibacteria group bacterium]|jgi:hypothetical protein
MAKPVFSELFIDHNNNEAEPHVIHVYTSEPTPLEEKNLGKIFAIFDFDKPERFTTELVDILDNAFTKAYYHSADFDSEVAFERTLQRVNKAVQDAITSYGEDWVYHVNAVLGVMHNNVVHFTYVGTMEAFLIVANNITPIIQHTQEEIKPLKLFNNILSGQNPETGALFFCTTNLLDYLSQEKIRRTVSEQLPAEAIQNFENILTEQTTLSSIAGLIIKILPDSILASQRLNQPATTNVNALDEALDHELFPDDTPRDSMSKLVHRERTTNDLLTPAIWPTIKQRLLKSLSLTPTNTTESSTHTVTGNNYWASLKPWLKKSLQIALTILNSIKKLLINIVLIIYDGIARLFKKQSPTLMRSSGRWQRLSPARRILAVVFVGVVLIFVVSLVWKNNSVQQQTQTDTYEKTLNEVENEVGQAESKHIIADDTAARDALTKAITAINNIPADATINNERKQNLQTRINALNNTLNKVNPVTVSLVGDFAQINNAGQITALTKIGEFIYGFDTSKQAVARINSADGTSSIVINPSTDSNTINALINDSAATTILALSNKKFAQFNPVVEKITSVTTGKLPDNTNVADIALFGTRLYVLDTVNNQIYRLQKTGDAYGDKTDWLKDPADFSQVQALAIDASIYVLTKSGEIKKYNEGKAVEFKTDNFTPGLAGATKLVKTNPAGNFYLLNPSTKLITILDNNGKLVQQLTAPEFEQLTDWFVDEAQQQIYVLAGTKLYKLAIPEVPSA